MIGAGGRVEPGESDAEGVVREMAEETGLVHALLILMAQADEEPAVVVVAVVEPSGQP